MAFLSASASDVPCRILLSSWQAERVAGERDEGVRRVREQSGANVQILLGQRLPAAFRARDEALAVILADGGDALRAAISGTLRRAFQASVRGNGGPGASGAVDAEDRQRTVEVMIPEVACRHLVGARGDRIKLLREEAGCDVQLAPGAVSGVAAQRRVRCSGQLAGVEEAVARVHEVLVEFMLIGMLHPRHFDLQEVSGVATNSSSPQNPANFAFSNTGTAKNSRLAVRVLVQKDECGWLIGKRGNKIHKLRELALVSTRDADADLGQLGASVLEIFGAPLAKELCVLQLVVDDLALMREASPITRLVIPVEFAIACSAELIGIQEKSGVVAATMIDCGITWTVIELRGSERERLAASGMIHEHLEKEAAAREANLQGGCGTSTANGGSLRSHTPTTAESQRLPRAAPPKASESSRNAEDSEIREAERKATEEKERLRQEQARRDSEERAAAAAQQRRVEERANEAERQAAAEKERARQAAREVEARAAAAAWTATTGRVCEDRALRQSEDQRARDEEYSGGSLSATSYANGSANGHARACPQSEQHRLLNGTGQPSANRHHQTMHIATAPVFTLPVTIPCLSAAPDPAKRAQWLASDASGIARRAGVTLSVDLRHLPVILVQGTPAANAVACFLIQKALWLDDVFNRSA